MFTFEERFNEGIAGTDAKSNGETAADTMKVVKEEVLLVRCWTVHSPQFFRVFSIDERAVRTARELDASTKRKKQGGGGGERCFLR